MGPLPGFPTYDPVQGTRNPAAPLEGRQTVPPMSTLPGDPQGPTPTGQSIIEQLLARIKGEDNPVTTGSANLGQVAGSLANDERMNRMAKGAFTQNYDQNMLAAQTGRNQNETDALRKIAITNYLKSGGFKGGPGSIQLGGQTRTLPTFGGGPRPASEAQMSSAGTLENMLQQRLASGGSYLPQPLESYAEPGKVENISRYGGTVASGLGVINDLMGGGNGNIYKKIGGGILGGLKKLVGK